MLTTFYHIGGNRPIGVRRRLSAIVYRGVFSTPYIRDRQCR